MARLFLLLDSLWVFLWITPLFLNCDSLDLNYCSKEFLNFFDFFSNSLKIVEPKSTLRMKIMHSKVIFQLSYEKSNYMKIWRSQILQVRQSIFEKSSSMQNILRFHLRNNLLWYQLIKTRLRMLFSLFLNLN